MTQKKIFSWACFILMGTVAMAQIELNHGAIIYGYDGSILVGEVITEDEVYIHLRIFTTDTVRVPRGMIQKKYKSPEEVLIYPEGKLHYTSGIFFSISNAFGGSDQSGSFDWDFIVGKRLTPKYSVGIGTAFSINTISLAQQEWIDAHFIPLFAYGRYYFNEDKRRFFAATKLGYGFPSGLGLEFTHSGGLHFQPSIGVHFASKKNRRIKMSIGYLLQKTKGTDTSVDVLNNPVSVNYDLWLSRVLFRFGWEFR